MESVLMTKKECYVCGSPYVENHHIFYGTANRKQSDKYGLTVWLCPEHHRGRSGVHFNRDLDMHLKKLAQEYFEAHIGSRDTFRACFGKSWI